MKKYFVINLIAVFSMVLISCSSNEKTTYVPVEPERKAQKTTVMVYLEGSDLEKSFEYGTAKLRGMLEAQYSNYLNVVVQTGGGNINYYDTPLRPDRTLDYYPVKDWTKVQRFQVTNKNLTLIEDLGTGCSSVDNPPANCTEMGTSEVLQDFIEKSVTQFPADRYILVLADHGGGPIGGYGGQFIKNMNINDIKKALDTATSNKNIKFEILCFDACLMANIEFAYNLRNSAKYLVAYEDLGWSSGWDYNTVLTSIAQNPKMTGAEIGKTISSSYATVNKELKLVTVSVTDLTKTEAIVNAIENITKVALEAFRSDKPTGWINFFNARKSTDEYGISVGETFYSNQIDISSFADSMDYYGGTDYLQYTNNLRNSIKEAVVHSVSYSLHPNSNGLSFWLPFHFEGSMDQQIRNVTKYKNLYGGTYEANFSNIYITLLDEMLQYAKETTSQLEVDKPILEDDKLILGITSNFGIDDTVLLLDKSSTDDKIEPVFASIAEVLTNGGDAFAAIADFNHKQLMLNGKAIFALPHNVATYGHGSEFNLLIPMFYKKAGSQEDPIKVYALAQFNFATGKGDMDPALIPTDSKGGDGFNAIPGDILIVPDVVIDVASKTMNITPSSKEITLIAKDNGGLELTQEADLTIKKHAFWIKNLKGDIAVEYFDENTPIPPTLRRDSTLTNKSEALAEALSKPFWTK